MDHVSCPWEPHRLPIRNFPFRQIKTLLLPRGFLLPRIYFKGKACRPEHLSVILKFQYEKRIAIAWRRQDFTGYNYRMNIELESGNYVVAVSGGVDSMVLLDLLVKKRAISYSESSQLDAAQGSQEKRENRTYGTENERQTPTDTTMRQEPAGMTGFAGQQGKAARGYRLVVAHFDHGIRSDSHLDRQLVQDVAARYNLQFVYDRAKLGFGVSEEKAREARYEFLRKVMRAGGAKAIITAHHQDDLVETAIHNILRGTGRKGLSSLSRSEVIRPLIKFSKRELQKYGKNQKLVWREDTTNQDLRYRRNYIRHNIIPQLGIDGLDELKRLVAITHSLSQEIDQEIAKLSQKLWLKGNLNRGEFIKLPHVVAREVMADWLRQHNIRQFDKKMLERLVIAAKTYKVGQYADIGLRRQLLIGKGHLTVVSK